MSQVVKSTLNDVLNNVIQNSAQLKAQVAEQEKNAAAGKEQLAKFDTLIASLQVAIADETLLEAIQAQEGANALVSPTLPAGAANDAPAGTSGESSQAVS